MDKYHIIQNHQSLSRVIQELQSYGVIFDNVLEAFQVSNVHGPANTCSVQWHLSQLRVIKALLT